MKPIETPYSESLAAARSYLAAGLSVLPIRTDGTKAPAVTQAEGWEWLQHTRLPPADLPRRFRGRGVGIVCGAISGGRTVIDLDDPNLIEPFRAAVEQAAPGLLDRLPRIGTPKNGEHYHLRCEGPTPPNQKLAMGMRPDDKDGALMLGTVKLKALLETRGEGGYVVAPGSPAKCHPWRKPYFHKGGPQIEQTPVVTAAERELMFRIARTFNEVEAELEFASQKHSGSVLEHSGSALKSSSTTAQSASPAGERVGDDFNARASWSEILAPHAWTECGGHGQLTHWRRPGKQGPGTSATTGCTSAAGNSLLCVFSTSAAPLVIPYGRTCGTYSKFAAYAALNHGGDFQAATRALSGQGYGPVGKSQSSNRSSPGGPSPSGEACASGNTETNSTERFGNARYERVESEAKAHGKSSGKTTTEWEARPIAIADIIADLRRRTGGPPYRSGAELFVPSGRCGVDWFKDAAGLFGWIQAELGVVDWCRGRGFVGREDFCAELARTSPEFEAVESLPHCPPLARHYYACGEPAPGDGSALRELLSRFSPASELDGDLVKAALVTPLWGGAGGSRPGFVVTSDAGRGMGKSSLVKAIGLLYGGLIDFGQRDDAASIKTRLLSSDAATVRVALIDNVKSHRFSSSDLEALVTAPYISGKRMYCGEARRPNTLTWFLTLNGASLSTDVAQRFACIKLAPPRRSASWEEDVTTFIERNRPQLIADIVAFYAGPPWPLERFSRWAAWEAAVVARLPEPADLQRMILERQVETDAEADEMSIVEDHFAMRLAEAGYDPQTTAVHIPNHIAAAWFGEATGERKGTGAVSRTVRQLSDEGALKLLSVNPSRANGRGLLWNVGTSDVDYSLAEVVRLRERTHGLRR